MCSESTFSIHFAEYSSWRNFNAKRILQSSWIQSWQYLHWIVDPNRPLMQIICWKRVLWRKLVRNGGIQLRPYISYPSRQLNLKGAIKNPHCVEVLTQAWYLKVIRRHRLVTNSPKKTQSKNAKCHNVVAWKKREKSKQNSSFKMHQNLIGSLLQTCFSTRWRHCLIAWRHLVKKVFDGGPIWNVFNSDRYFHSLFHTSFPLRLASVFENYI